MVAEQAHPAGRGDPEQARKSLAEDRLCLVALRHIDEIARQQPVLVKGRSVGFQPALVLETAFDEVERNLRQPPLCHTVQVFDIDGLVDPHRRAFSRSFLKGAGPTRNFADFRITRQSPAERGWGVCREELQYRSAFTWMG